MTKPNVPVPGANIDAADLVFLNGFNVNTGVPPTMAFCDVMTYMVSGATTFNLWNGTLGYFQTRSVISDWASASQINSIVVLGGFAYVLIRSASSAYTYRVYRYLVTNLAAGGTLMTQSGQSFTTSTVSNIYMTSDGTSLYLNYGATNSSNDYAISKYSVATTVMTFVSTTSCGSSAHTMDNFLVDLSGNYYGIKNGEGNIRKYNSSGTLQTTSAFTINTTNVVGLFNFATSWFAVYQYSGGPAIYELLPLI